MTDSGRVHPGTLPPAAAQGTTAGYNAIKEFEGRKYTGMRVGGSHSWYYQQGEWKETKVAPDRWQFTFAVNKRRRWDAPEGSGAPVGTEYHWYILAHQSVRKLNANEYSTSMEGTKYKLAHRRAGSEEWSAGDRARLRRSIAILEENIIQLRRELREEDEEQGAMPQEEPVVMAPARRRRETVGVRRASPKGLPPRFTIGQQLLEAYSAP